MFVCLFVSMKLDWFFFFSLRKQMFFQGKKMTAPGGFLLLCHVFLANLLSKTTCEPLQQEVQHPGGPVSQVPLRE